MVNDFYGLKVGALLTVLVITGCEANSSQNPPSKQATASPADSAAPLDFNTNSTTPPTASPTAPLTAAIDRTDLGTQRQIQQYLSKLAAEGFATNKQGIWLQTDQALLSQHQGTVPLSAASLTKVATSLATLQTWGTNHQFVTQIGKLGAVQDGVLQGDLVVQGGEDPLFIWEEAIALGNTLNQLGIRRVTGNLIVTGKFYMNFEQEALKSGELLKQAIDATLWSAEVSQAHQSLPSGAPRPQVSIQGSVKMATAAPKGTQAIVRHYSLPTAELLKKMNQFSNNPMAEILAAAAGGAKAVEQKVVQATDLPNAEINLINGSGLGEENRISPRMVCAMFRAIERSLQSQQMTVGDIFTIVGQDEGILHERRIPTLSVVKSGSLNAVSALAGALPTQRGTVWFVIMNGGFNLEGFRADQEALLQNFSQQWGTVRSLPPQLMPSPSRKSKTARNEVVG
jgi:D-alanyl-D-alanine carboxypeptidase/D-alanyl-D-alanine-endopeptidase (penicillin-binding protein 4)